MVSHHVLGGTRPANDWFGFVLGLFKLMKNNCNYW